jgi:MOSC domain-containing protein YiiM
MPCFKLGIRFGRPDILKRFLHSGRSGFYFAVLLEGEVAAGDRIEQSRKRRMA